MRELALFAGGGGGIWGSLLLGHTTVCAVEIVEANRRILLQRQLDGIFPIFPIWDDVRTFSGHEWRGKVDIVSGGFPCQDISCAGKGAGISGERSGLWAEMARIIGEVRPRYAFVENSPMLVTRGLDRVLCDLAAMGFDAEWGVIGAHHFGAPHKRERLWIVANSANAKWGERRFSCNRMDWENCVLQRQESASRLEIRINDDANFNDKRELQQDRGITHKWRWSAHSDSEGQKLRGWPAEPGLVRLVYGVANRSQRIFALGNGQVPRVAAAAWRILSERI